MKKTSILLRQIMAVFTVCAASVATSSAQIITTYAGTGAQGYTGDGGACGAATFAMGWGKMAQDAVGNLYLADDLNNVVRKITAAGIVSTFAGNGTEGNSGDGGAATAASIDAYMAGLAVDATGNIYIGSGNKIRKVNTTGIISTYAGTGSTGYSGDGGQATAANINSAISLAFDGSGNLYFIDRGERIRRIAPSGTISTIAGNGTWGLAGDGGPATAAAIASEDLTVDATGNLLIVDAMNSRIRKVNGSGTISTIAGSSWGFSGDGGPASAAMLSQPLSITTDGIGNIYTYDWGNRRLRKINTSGIISTIGGNGTGGSSGDGGPATAASTDSIQSIVVKPSGDIYLYCGAQNKIRKISASGTGIEQVASLAYSLSVAPNPTQGKLSVNFTSPTTEPVQVIVSNTLGMKLKEYTLAPNIANEIDLQLPTGLYYVSALSSAGREVKPIIIE